MNNEIKVSKWYDPAKMQKSVFMMEQFWLLSQDISATEDDRKAAKGLFEHYRRLAMCILMKEFPQELKSGLIIDVDFMKHLYDKYQEKA